MIDVQPEPAELEAGEILERCCFCRKQTQYWTVNAQGVVDGKSVACCCNCSMYADAKDVPSKTTWFRRETIASHQFPRIKL